MSSLRLFCAELSVESVTTTGVIEFSTLLFKKPSILSSAFVFVTTIPTSTSLRTASKQSFNSFSVSPSKIFLIPISSKPAVNSLFPTTASSAIVFHLLIYYLVTTNVLT